MVSIASELLPEPLGPQQTLICSRGSVTLTFFRLCCCAPSTVRCVICPWSTVRRPLPFLPFLLSFGDGPRTTDNGPLSNARPVCDRSHFATSSGVPAQTTSPPPLPPSGPRSITQSAVLITSRLCSITTTVLPPVTKLCSTCSNLLMS